jgi:hypothetical protein
MADKVINVDIKTNVQGVKNLRTELRETKEALQQATDPKEMERLVQKAAELQDKMADVNEQIAVFASGSKYEQASNGLGQVGSALRNLDFDKASERAKSFATVAGNISFGDAITSLKQLGSTFVSLGKALLTNPIFILAAVVTAIVVGIYKLLDSLGIIQKIFDAIGDAIGWVVQQLKDFLDLLGLTSYAADEEAEAEKKRQAAVKAAREQAHNQYMKEKEFELRQLKATSGNLIEIEDAEISLAKTRAEASAARLKQEGKAMEAIVAQLRAWGQLEAATKVQIELDNLRNKAKEDEIALIETEARVQKAREDRAKASADKAKAQREKEKQEKDKEADEALKRERDRIAALQKLEDDYWLRQQSQEDQEVIRRQQQLDKELEIAEGDNELQLQLIEEFERDAAAIRQKYRDEEAEAIKKAREEQDKKDKEAKAEQEEREKALADMKQQLTTMALASLLSNLEQGSKAAKAVAVAQATYDTFKGIQAIFANAAANPSTILFPAQPFIQAAAAGAFGIGNIRKIMSTNPTGGGVPSVGGGSSAPSFPQQNATPSFGLFGQPNQGNNVQAGAMVTDAQPMQIKIGIDEVTDTQNRVGRMRLNAEI